MGCTGSGSTSGKTFTALRLIGLTLCEKALRVPCSRYIDGKSGKRREAGAQALFKFSMVDLTGGFGAAFGLDARQRAAEV